MCMLLEGMCVTLGQTLSKSQIYVSIFWGLLHLTAVDQTFMCILLHAPMITFVQNNVSRSTAFKYDKSNTCDWI